MLLGEVAERDVHADLDGACRGLLDSGQAAQQARLAGAVLADHSDAVATARLDPHRAKHLLRAVGDRDRVDVERDVARSSRGRQLQGDLLVAPVHSRAIVLHPADTPVERLSGLGALLGLASHRVGELAQALDLSFLLGVRLLGLGGVELELGREGAVVALVLAEATIGEVQHLGNGLVEQVEVVAHHEDGALERVELVDEPALGGKVEVVRGLIQDHDLGLLEEEPHDVHPTALPS